ncbi:hypothetical protein KHP62_15150 [Rhodobacteraceae bacterium NNCM2]|nr:hypothetical protein [Coraliihabitans acroporae]
MSGQRRVLHIHAGLPKTGSSAIQRFLATNREEIARSGLIVPEASLGERGDHHDWFFRLGGLSGRDRSRAVKELTGWMDKADGENFLISSEFAYLMMRFGFAGRGYRAIKRRGFALKFHMFVRPQTDFAASAYPEFLRNLLVPQPFGRFVETNFFPFARDYGEIVRKLERVSGEPVGLLPYTTAARRDGVWWSLFDSIGAGIGPEERAGFALPGEVNPSLGPMGVSALMTGLQRIDRRKIARRWGLRLALRRTVLEVTANFPREEARYNPLTLTKRSEMWEACRPFNDPLAQTHWGRSWDEVFATELETTPRRRVFRRHHDEIDEATAALHDRMARRLTRRIKEASERVTNARRGFNPIRFFGTPIDRLADRAMRQIVRGF